MNDEQLQEALNARPALRVTPADIKAAVIAEFYFTAGEGTLGAVVADNARRNTDEDGDVVVHLDRAELHASPAPLDLLTFCVLLLRNGFTVVGTSACASPENFDAEIGRTLARKDAEGKIWPLLGYELRTKLAG